MEYPGGQKTGITYTNDSSLLVGLKDGVILSKNKGKTFSKTLNASSIFTLFSSKDGKILGGGTGKIYLSNNFGNSWDSVSIASTYPVLRIIENNNGDLFAITGTLDVNLGFVGDGVFYSGDKGLSWTNRNQGLGIYLSCEAIAVDKNDRLYLSVADEYVTGNAGLFISEDNGLNWQLIPIEIDGKMAIPNQIKIANAKGISVSSSDTVYYSLEGVASNVAVRLNLKKHINQVKTSSLWQVYKIGNSVSWWLDLPLNSIYYANNNYRYSSTTGSSQTGATYLTQNDNCIWERIDSGLGLTYSGMRNVQFFTQDEGNTVFMIQLFDDKIYYHKSSITSTGLKSENRLSTITISPNPVEKTKTIVISSYLIEGESSVSMYDSVGNKLEVVFSSNNQNEFTAPEKSGLYFIKVETNHRIKFYKLIVL
jgi:hypothetical protein